MNCTPNIMDKIANKIKASFTIRIPNISLLIMRYIPRINPRNNKVNPTEPKKCKGRFTKRVRKNTVIRAQKPFIILE